MSGAGLGWAALAWVEATIRLSTPLVMAAMGGLVAERAGILTFGMEGAMLAGALAGILGVHFGGGSGAGLLAALVTGASGAAAFGWLSIRRRTDQVVTAVAFNLLASGLTSFVASWAFGLATDPVRVPRLPVWNVPGLAGIPVVGPALGSHPPTTFLAFLMVPATAWFLVRTRPGLWIRACGESPQAVAAAGLDVAALRLAATVYAGAVAALARASLSVGTVGQFAEGMSAGRGFLAYAAIVFGRWRVGRTALGAVLFGAVDALQLRLQALEAGLVPYQLLVASPYVATLLALAVSRGAADAPRASGRPFDIEER